MLIINVKVKGFPETYFTEAAYYFGITGGIRVILMIIGGLVRDIFVQRRLMIRKEKG